MTKAILMTEEEMLEKEISGAFSYKNFGGLPDDGQPDILHFICPCGCKRMYGIRFRSYPDRQLIGWTWDGNRESPTCTPSIMCYNDDGSEHWHGYLTKGEFV